MLVSTSFPLKAIGQQMPHCGQLPLLCSLHRVAAVYKQSGDLSLTVQIPFHCLKYNWYCVRKYSELFDDNLYFT